ncbi:trans-sialidase, putative [Trypanosoma cruzi]|nr:trans-sialidase, putative [Trypanosoma cruzi]
MMVPLTVEGRRCSLFHSFFLFSFSHNEGKEVRLNANRYCENSKALKGPTAHTPPTHTYIYMLSRVAAVMAPRTHNRHRVTGSRGRRREGGESEPQRRNMSRHLFYSAVLLLLVVMVCCGSGAVTAKGEVQESTVPTFVWNKITEGVTVESLGVPGLLKVGSDVFAVAEAQCKKDSVIFTGIASQIITKDNANAPVGALTDPKDKTQFLEEGASENPKKVDVSRPTTVVKGNDIYMLVGKYSQAAATGKEDGRADDGGLLLVKGKVSADESGSGKRI